jgi:hypothetical protein
MIIKAPKLVFRYAINCLLLAPTIFASCISNGNKVKDEQIRVQPGVSDANDLDSAQANSIQNSLSLNEIATSPNNIVLTGMAPHRLVPIYRIAPEVRKNMVDEYGSYRTFSFNESETEQFFMPGIDLLHGYNLLNVAHYDLSTEQLNYLFPNPVLIKSLYYPSFEQDSLDKKPINRDFYLTSVYDEDTNGDTLINKKDLRRFYHFNASCTEKHQLVPSDYSVVRSQYDSKNDIMYVFARRDVNKDGAVDKKEPLHIFWLSLKKPSAAKRLY